MNKLKERIERFNNELYGNEKDKLNSKWRSFNVVKGKIPVIISAPHTVKQLRERKIKEAENQTGAIANIIWEETGCFTIYKTYNISWKYRNLDNLNNIEIRQPQSHWL